MKKLLAFLALALITATGAWADNITSVDQANQTRNALTVSTDMSTLTSATGAGTTFNAYAPNFLFQFKKSGENSPDPIVFTDQLTVTVNDVSGTLDASVNLIKHEDGTIDFSLPNFVLASGEDVMPVGNININGLSLVAGENYDTFSYDGPLTISAGDLEGVDMWMGPMLGELPLKLQGKVNFEDHKLFVNIDIDLSASLSQIINVKFGTDFVPVIEDGYYQIVSADSRYEEIQGLQKAWYFWNDGTPCWVNAREGDDRQIFYIKQLENAGEYSIQDITHTKYYLNNGGKSSATQTTAQKFTYYAMTSGLSTIPLMSQPTTARTTTAAPARGATSPCGRTPPATSVAGFSRR